MKNDITATVRQLAQQAIADDDAHEECLFLKGMEHTHQDSPYKDFAEHMQGAHPSSDLFQSVVPDVLRSFTKILDNVLADIALPVEFKQCSDPYFFSVSSVTFFTYIPLVATRAIFCFLKASGVKCVIYKRDKNLCSQESVCCTELAFLGKTDSLIKGFEPIAKACKKIKGRLSPWYSSSEPLFNPVNTHPNEASLRFSGAPWFGSAQANITLIGCGGLSSNIAVSLCRVMGNATLNLYDSDIVEQRNLAGQNFGVSDIGKYKARCVAEQCMNLNPQISTCVHVSNFSRNDSLSNIVITGLDNMASRNVVFYSWQELWKNKGLLIDARLSAEKWQIFCIRADDQKAKDEYAAKWLFSDDEATSDVCSYKQTAFAAQMCASFVTNLYINYCSNLDKIDTNPLYRFLPFMTEYDASQLHLKFIEL